MNKAGWHGAGRTVRPCGGCTFPARRSWVVATMATLVSCPRGHVQQAQGWLVRGPAGGVRQGQPEAERTLPLPRTMPLGGSPFPTLGSAWGPFADEATGLASGRGQLEVQGLCLASRCRPRRGSLDLLHRCEGSRLSSSKWRRPKGSVGGQKWLRRA